MSTAVFCEVAVYFENITKVRHLIHTFVFCKCHNGQCSILIMTFKTCRVFMSFLLIVRE